jgi:uncharacterized membrane protein
MRFVGDKNNLLYLNCVAVGVNSLISKTAYHKNPRIIITEF